MAITLTDEMIKRSVANFGNPYRLSKLFSKAERGEEITYVSIGGSITMGCNASSENQYPKLIAKWLKDTFPNAKVNFVNAGIGATGSLIGLHRLQRDVLTHNPDFVTVEFSVNDNSTNPTSTLYYDNLLFNILNSDTKPAVLAIGMFCPNGTSAQELHLPVAEHYGVPYISVRDALYPEMKAGNMTWADYSNDDVHPINAGHIATVELVSDYLEGIMGREYEGDTPCVKHFTNDLYIDCELVQSHTHTPKSFGAFAPAKTNVYMLPNGWRAEENGEPIEFFIPSCRSVSMLFERTNKGNGGKAVAVCEGKEELLDADFKDGWGIYANNRTIFTSDVPRDVTLTVTPDLEEGKFFTLVAVMVAH